MLYDIDDLEQVAEANLNGRHREAERADRIVREELSLFRDRRRAAATGPAVGALWAWAESIRQSELAEIEKRSGSLAPDARRQLDAVTRSLVKKLLHEPTLRLRTLASRGDGVRHLESLHYPFGLADADEGLAQVVPIECKPAEVDAHVG
jgi:glutamyl-tRNA reductase